MIDFVQTTEADSFLIDDFHALCGFGGRLAGSGEDTAAMQWALGRLREIGPRVTHLHVPYDGWRCKRASLSLLGAQDLPGTPGASETTLTCNPLLRSASTPLQGLTGEVIDLGEGRVEDFERHGEALRGKIVLVRHEYPFSPRHLHRRRKYDLAVARGAIGFLIANPLPGRGALSGSSGRPAGGAGIPAAYIDFESAEKICRAGASARVRLLIEGEELSGAQADVGVLDLPGGSSEKIVISAHIDGHHLGCSALDNATGVVVALAAARALAPLVGQRTHSLRICFFSAEEWGLAGSASYLRMMDAAELASMRLNINLDTVAGDDSLTALTSGFPALQGFVEASARAAGLPIGHYLPLMPNSDHANFAARGIPALRLVAGFDRPASRVNNILAAGDQPDVVREEELRNALLATRAMGWHGLSMSKEALMGLSDRA